MIYDGKFEPGETYILVVFIEDGGDFDLDGDDNGVIIDPMAFFRTKTGSGSGAGGNGVGGGGCDAMTVNAGLGLLALFIVRKRKFW